MYSSKRNPVLGKVIITEQAAIVRIAGFQDAYTLQAELLAFLDQHNVPLDWFGQHTARLSQTGTNEIVLVLLSVNYQKFVSVFKQFVEKSEKNSCLYMQGTDSVAKLGFEGVKKGSQIEDLPRILNSLTGLDLAVELCFTSNNMSSLLFDRNYLAEVKRLLNDQFILAEYYAKNCQGA